MHLADGNAVRAACRGGGWAGPTAGLAPGFVQANLVILPADWAFEFLLFCQRNPRPCPVVDVTDIGDPCPRFAAKSGDLRTDLPGYRVWRHGELTAEPADITSLWQGDFVGFLLGCSFTFESALLAAGVPVRHVEEGRNVPMYRTNIACRPAGRFAGPMVVSMRPMTESQYHLATKVCSRYPECHGEPVHFSDPAAIGIADLARPDYGESVSVRPGEEPAFWACGVTPQAALLNAKPPLAITHRPGHMFVTDLADGNFCR